MKNRGEEATSSIVQYYLTNHISQFLQALPNLSFRKIDFGSDIFQISSASLLVLWLPSVGVVTLLLVFFLWLIASLWTSYMRDSLK